jgi:aryl-alcohol dehydrogenase-like predicted oxidoreductase
MNARHSISRRTFFKTIAGAAAAAGLAAAARPIGGLDALAAPQRADVLAGPMPARALGRTGHRVRLFSLGGQAVLETPGTEETSLAILNRAIDLGVNYLDTARRYGRGTSEGYLGRVMKSRRKEVFLASKTRERTYDGAMRELEESLATLQTDHLDLWQCHNVMYDAELDQMLAKDGVLKAMEKAREQKLVRFAGITGHYDPHVLRRGIERYPFDTILMALNAADRHRASFIEHLLPVAVGKRMGVIGMKIPARGRLLREGGVATMTDAMRYVLTLPVSTVIVGVDTVAELEENVAIARGFEPLPPAGMQRLEELARPYAEEAMFFKLPA